MGGEAFLTKKELMRRADASGLASRPGAIYGRVWKAQNQHTCSLRAPLIAQTVL